jgi:hypothetical protein
MCLSVSETPHFAGLSSVFVDPDLDIFFAIMSSAFEDKRFVPRHRLLVMVFILKHPKIFLD